MSEFLYNSDMPLQRKPKRAPGENRVLRRRFVAELRIHDHVGDLGAFLDPLADEHLDTDNPFWLIAAELAHLVLDAIPPRRTEAALTPLGRSFFRSWLRHHGIDPETGKMTLDGLAFFEEIVKPDSDDLDNPQRRAA